MPTNNLANTQSSPESFISRVAGLETALFADEAIMAVNAAPQVLSGAPGHLAISPAAVAVLLTKASAGAYTLAQPVSGAPPLGQDGATLTITDTTGHAHTVTTAANGIGGADDTFTFSGTVNTSLQLVANAGVWYATALGGGALSEV